MESARPTLFRMITKTGAARFRPDTDRRSVSIGHVDHQRDSLDGSKTIFEEISNGKDKDRCRRQIPFPSPCLNIARFNFKRRPAAKEGVAMFRAAR